LNQSLLHIELHIKHRAYDYKIIKTLKPKIDNMIFFTF